MRKIVFLAPALLAACATAPAATPVHGVTPGKTCNAAGTARFIAQPGTSATGAAIKRATNATILRWAPPGTMMTMEFSPERVTVYLGPDNKVTQITCM
ncbi:MAG: I78 family peptidase inhibitor [Sphingomicrobium sp.]